MTVTGDRRVAAGLFEVADGVHAFVQPDGGWCVNNAGLVTGGGPPVLVDTAATRARAVALRDRVVAVSGRMPGVVVDTHHHGDHVFGNDVFAGSATLVAHRETRTEMLAAGLGLQRLWPDVEWGPIELVAPTLTFDDAITLHVGDRRVELLHVGPAHTTNDVVAWVPDARVLFAGDVVMSGVTPYCLMGSIAGSLAALDRLRALRPAVVVPGHGPVGGPELIEVTDRYLRWVRDLAADGTAAGLSAIETARAARLGEFAQLLDSERLVGNLHRAFAEVAAPDRLGEPLDVVASFREMVAFHGGLPTCHA